MNTNTAVVGFAADFPNFVDEPYKGDYLITVDGDTTILIELDDIVLDL